MFERFTDGARRVVVLAQEESRGLDHHLIGTEHLLLGLLHEQPAEPESARVLNAAGLTLDQCRADVARSVPPAPPDGPAGHIPFGPDAKKSLEHSLRAALELRQNTITTGHLLLGLLRVPDGRAVQLLGAAGADLTAVQAAATSAALAIYGREPRPGPLPGDG